MAVIILMECGVGNINKNFDNGLRSQWKGLELLWRVYYLLFYVPHSSHPFPFMGGVYSMHHKCVSGQCPKKGCHTKASVP